MKLLRGWGFPIGLLTAWALAVAYALYAISGMESAVQAEHLAAIAAMQAQTTASPARAA